MILYFACEIKHSSLKYIIRLFYSSKLWINKPGMSRSHRRRPRLRQSQTLLSSSLLLCSSFLPHETATWFCKWLLNGRVHYPIFNVLECFVAFWSLIKIVTSQVHKISLIKRKKNVVWDCARAATWVSLIQKPQNAY